jgi:hypothetical protein
MLLTEDRSSPVRNLKIWLPSKERSMPRAPTTSPQGWKGGFFSSDHLFQNSVLAGAIAGILFSAFSSTQHLLQ